MTKIVYNSCFGGFSLSDKAKKLWIERGGDPEALKSWSMFKWRADPILVDIVEKELNLSGGSFSDLQIAEVPAGSKYRIDEYDGNERVMTVDDYEWLTA